MNESQPETPIAVQNKHLYAIAPQSLMHAAQTVLAQHDRAGAGLQIVLDDDDSIQALNRQYRGVDAPTDVLSFPADPLPAEFGEPDYLGDLVIAVHYAEAQAARLGHSFSDTMALLIVHGTLHLLGYDHDTPENRAAMWQQQAHALRALGIAESIVPALEETDHGE